MRARGWRMGDLEACRKAEGGTGARGAKSLAADLNALLQTATGNQGTRGKTLPLCAPEEEGADGLRGRTVASKGTRCGLLYGKTRNYYGSATARSPSLRGEERTRGRRWRCRQGRGPRVRRGWERTTGMRLALSFRQHAGQRRICAQRVCSQRMCSSTLTSS